MLFRSNDTATTEIYTLSLHDALPICDVFVAISFLLQFEGHKRREGIEKTSAEPSSPLCLQLDNGNISSYYYRMALSYDDKVFRYLFLGFIRIHILYHASKESVFGLSLIKELERHGYRISPGTLYPILHQMESSGFLFSEKAVINGKMRKYYQITDEGKLALSQSYEKIDELTKELNE